MKYKDWLNIRLENYVKPSTKIESERFYAARSFLLTAICHFPFFIYNLPFLIYQSCFFNDLSFTSS